VGITVDEAGRALGVSSSTIWRLVRRGELLSVRHRGRRLVLKRSLGKAGTRVRGEAIPPLTAQHPIFRLVGAGHGGGRSPGARDKHALADR
jgi:excisionase family DNA binding protein